MSEQEIFCFLLKFSDCFTQDEVGICKGFKEDLDPILKDGKGFKGDHS